MLMAHPAILRNLVEQYRTLHVQHAEQESFETRRQLEDVTYTLCVSTGTYTADAALNAAEEQLTLTDPAATLNAAADNAQLAT